MKSLVLLLSIFVFQIQAQVTGPNRDQYQVFSKIPHRVTLVNHGLSALEIRLQMIERAQKTIDVEYYIYNLDKSGRILSQALIKKAREGVKVRLLLDYMMAKNQFSPFYAYQMEKYGVEVKYFNASSTLNLFSGQYRNHRKVLIIDGVEAITGGRNIADEYFEMREDFNFLDRDILVKGEIVSSIKKTFDYVWNINISEKVKREKMPQSDDVIYRQNYGEMDSFRYRSDLKFYNQKVSSAVEFLTISNSTLLEEVREKGKRALALEYSGNCDNISFHSEYPTIGKQNTTERIIKYDIGERIRNAKESILFDSPYFIVENELKDDLNTAIDNKVKITLLANSIHSTDAVYVYAAFDRIIKSWINKGVETYILKGHMPESYTPMNDKTAKARFGVHAKSFVFDKKDVVIGTFNFDPRSANINTEMIIACNDNPELAQAVAADIEERIKASIYLDSSTKVDEYESYQTGFFKMVTYYIFKVPTKIFEHLL
jgi:putative cardiolipin synthase